MATSQWDLTVCTQGFWKSYRDIGYLSTPLEGIFQKSLDDKELPLDWKQARISAIYKKGNRSLAGNYRPVSLTSIVCKSMERIIRDWIVTHMTENKLFSKKQYGFIKHRSTVLQLLKVLDIWTDATDRGDTIDTIYLDFMKAFDMVPHRRLLGKLSAYGICHPVLGWIQSYLTDRVQQVCVNGANSEWLKVTSWVPQGSVLGPVLFVIYINDLPDSLDSSAYLFADDTKVFRIIKDTQDKQILQQDMDILIDWSDMWLLASILWLPSWQMQKYDTRSL